MSASNDPTRWSDASSDDAPAELSRLLRSAREDLPGPRELAALGIVLPAGLGTGTGGAAVAAKAKVAAGTAAKASAVGAVSKVTGALVLAVVTGASFYAVYSNDEPRPETLEPTISAVPQTPPQARTSEDEPSAVVSEAPTQAMEAVPDVQQPDEPTAPAQRGTPATKPSDELPLLQRARRALSSNPEQALALVRRHEREFPRGKYVQEREVIRIEALRRTGNMDEANRRGDDFKRRFPGSAHESKLDREGQ